MELNDREKDALKALSGTVKSALSMIPVLAQAISGWDAYKRSSFERNVKRVIAHLEEKIKDLNLFFSDEWLRSEEGQQFSRKVFDSAFDVQLEDKQELFINALINGIHDQDTSPLEKLKFVDMLRQLSRASLMVLADIHKMFKNKVRGPKRHPDSTDAFPLVDPTTIAEKLSKKFDPFLVTASISEMESQGLFSRTGDWKKKPDGSYMPSGGFATELCYTDFAARFVEFITTQEPK